MFYSAKILKEKPEVPRMRMGGFNPASLNLNIDDAEIQRQVNESVREYLAKTGSDIPAQIQEAIAALDQLDLGDVQSVVQSAIAGLPEGITEQQVQSLIDANPNLSREDVIRLIQENPEITTSDVQTQISQALSGLPEGITEEDVRRIVEANPGLTEEMVLTLIKNNQGVSLQDIENAISTAMANIPSAQENEQRLREIAEELFYEDYRRDPYQGDFEGSEQAELEQFVADFIADRVGAPLSTVDIQSLIQNQIDAGLASGDIASGDITGDVTQTLQEMIATGTLTPDEIQRRIDAGDITKEDVLAIIQGGFDLSEDQFAQLFAAGILTQDEIAALIEGAIAESDADVEEQIADAVAATGTGLTEEQVNQLISQGLEGFDTSQFATQEQLQGLENLFQNYLTPEQLESYLGQQQFVTPDQLAAATDYDSTIKELTDKLGDLETKYQDVQSQYEADAVNQQIQQTKDDLNTFFAGAVPSGPRTGSTSQFSAGASFLPGSSPMANLIAGQREGLGQDAFSTYLKTFTPSYGEYESPVDPEEYGKASTPLIGTQYSNPFTGGSYNQGGQVSNGIMDLTNFDTNVAPFQNAFRPNVPRN